MNVETFKELIKDFQNENLNTILVHPSIMKEYWQITKWEWFREGFFNIRYIIDCYDTVEHFPDDFWESLSWGWMCEYIYPYDDPYNPWISPERKLRLGRWS